MIYKSKKQFIMKGFIKIIDTRDQEYYINIDYIIQFTTTSENQEGNTIIDIKYGERVSTIQTNSTVEEVLLMIVSSNK